MQDLHGAGAPGPRAPGSLPRGMAQAIAQAFWGVLPARRALPRAMPVPHSGGSCASQAQGAASRVGPGSPRRRRLARARPTAGSFTTPRPTAMGRGPGDGALPLPPRTGRDLGPLRTGILGAHLGCRGPASLRPRLMGPMQGPGASPGARARTNTRRDAPAGRAPAARETCDWRRVRSRSDSDRSRPVFTVQSALRGRAALPQPPGVPPIPISRLLECAMPRCPPPAGSLPQSRAPPTRASDMQRLGRAPTFLYPAPRPPLADSGVKGPPRCRRPAGGRADPAPKRGVEPRPSRRVPGSGRPGRPVSASSPGRLWPGAGP